MTTRCIGCGAEVADIAAPTHRYIGASPGCWGVYSDLLGRAADTADFQTPPEHRIIVDTYAAQHPGVESLQSIRSVAVHLIALHLVLEEGLPLHAITDTVRYHAKRPQYRWLDPPRDLGTLTVVDLQAERDPRSYAQLCMEWADDVWHAWCAHHHVIRGWAKL